MTTIEGETVAFYIANALGRCEQSPSPEQMRAFIEALDPADEEHGAAWLATEDDYSLEWSVDGRLVFDTPVYDGIRHLPGATRERALELWGALARGDLAYVERQPWEDGNGYVLTPERAAELERGQREFDRAFYESLGAEREDTRCRRDECGRGAVAHSVLCRIHHFESIQGRASPFTD